MSAESRKKYQFLYFILIIFFLTLTLKWLYGALPHTQAGKDFAAYWASARLLIHGQNPYLSDQIFALQTLVGWTDKMPLVMYNPPWVLTFILPFSIENYLLGKFLWLLLLISCILISLNWLWQFYGGTKANRHWNLLILCSYTPVYFVLIKVSDCPSHSSWNSGLFTLREAKEVVPGRSICVFAWHKTTGFISIYYSAFCLGYL